MSIREQKKWVIGAFVVIAVAMAVMFGIGFYRSSQRIVASENAQNMQEVASLKEIAAALKDPARRDAAVLKLREQQDVAAVDLLAALGHKNKDPEVRAAALTALGGIVDPEDMRGVQVLTIGARDFEPAVRIAAIRALGQVATDTAYMAVADALVDADVEVRRAAAEVLSLGKGCTGAVSKVAKAFGDEEDVEARCFMAAALGRTQDRDARRALLRVFGRDVEKEAVVRTAAVKSLGAWRDSYGAQGLAVGMCDVDDGVREQAKALFVELDSSAITNLTVALKSGQVRGALRGARGRGTLEDMLDVLESLNSPETAEPLVEVLDVSLGSGGKLTYPSIRDRAVGQLKTLREPAVAALAKTALKGPARLAMKVAAAETFAGVGVAAGAPVQAYISSTKVLPSSEEAGIWADMFKRIGGEGAAAGIALARSRDPVEFFKQYAKSVPPADTKRPPAPQLQEFSLVLHSGVYTGNPPNVFERRKDTLPFVKNRSLGQTAIRKYVPKGRGNVAMDLVRLKDGWKRIMCHPSCFNHIMFGKADRLSVTDDCIEGHIRVHMWGDGWIVGGAGEYTINLKKLEDGSYRGTYEGTYRDVPIEGIATCVEKPKRQPLRAGFRPVQPNEHPRLLFRKDDLPRLKARLNTPFGRAAFRRMATAPYIVRHESASYVHVALGLLYQLTGDPAYAMRAIPMVEREMDDHDMGFMGLGQVWGGRFGNVVMAYDLCYEAWPADFRGKVNRYLVNGGYATAMSMYKFSSCANTHPCSNYFSPICGGGAMMALGYWMDPGGPPAPPIGAKLLEPGMLEGRPAPGVPVLPLRGGKSPASWLWSGLLYIPTTPDELVDAVRADPDTPVGDGRVVEFAGTNFTFHAPPAEVLRGGIYPWIKVSEERPGCPNVGMVLYTVFENVRPGYYRVSLPGQGSTHCLINGTRLVDRAYVHLDTGLYPVLLAYTGEASMVVPVGVRFDFMTDKREEIDVLVAEAAAKAWGLKVVYDLDMAEHKATGMDGWKVNVMNRTMQQMIRSHRLLMGNGGYQSEGEGYHHTAIDPIRYAAMCWNVFGQTLTPYPDVTHSVVRHLGAGLLIECGKRGAGLSWQSFNGGNYNGNPYGFTCVGFQFTPEEYKPALLWLWNRMAGVEDPKDPESYVNLIDGKGLGHVIYTFVNYPLDYRTGLCSIEPRHPNEAFPKTWQATDKGLYVFRNQWKDTSDIVLQVYANELMSKGHGQPDTGGIRLHGLGYNWTTDSPGKGTPYRWLQNVVVMPPKVGMKRFPGVVTSWSAATNGSGNVSINMNLVYKGSERHDGVGTWPADPIAPGPVRGLRAVAVDYSGKCGAPALFAFVDRIEGGPDRYWLWRYPRYRPKGKAETRVTTEDNTFTVQHADASLRAVFIAPGDAAPEAPCLIKMQDLTPEEIEKRKEKQKPGAPEPGFARAPLAVKAKPGQSFFVVMTMQKGPAPKVKVVSGEGLDAVVDVGGQKVRFDGENVLIGDGPKEINRGNPLIRLR